MTAGSFAAVTWNGNTSNAWGLGTNWSSGAVPTVADDAIIPTSPAGGRFPTISTGTYAVKKMTIQASATVTQTGGTLQVDSDWGNSGTFTASGGTVQFTGNGGAGATFASGTSQFYHVIVDSGVDPKFDQDASSSILVAGNFTNNNANVANSVNATFTFNGTGSQSIYSAGTSGKSTFGHLVIDNSSGTVSTSSSVEISGNATLTNGTLDVGSNLFGRTANGGTLTLSNSSTLKIGGTSGFPTSFTTRSLSSTSTVNYYGSAQTVTALTYGNLTLSGSGTKTMPGTAFTVAGNFVMSGTPSATAAQAISVTGDFTIGSGCTFNAASYTHNLSGNFTNEGTFTASTSTMNFTGATSKTISGTSTTTFNNLTVNKGTSSASVLEATSGIGMASGGLTLTNGTFKLSSSSTITAFTADITASPYRIPSTAGLWVNGGTVSATANTTIQGLLRVSSGTMNIGAAADEGFIAISGAALTIDGGTLNLAGQLSRNSTANPLTFNMSSGSLIVPTVGSASTTLAPFTMDQPGSSFSMSGGTIIIRNEGGTGANDLGYVNLAGTTNVTGGTLQIGDASTSAGQTMQINSSAPIWNLTVNGSNSPTAKLLTNALTVKNNLTLTSGTLDANSLELSVAGAWTNNVSTSAFTPGTGAVTFNGSSAQSLGGSYATTFYGLTMNNSSGLSPSVSPTVNGTLTLTSGKITLGAYNLTLGSAAGVSGGSSSSYVLIDSTGVMIRQSVGTTAVSYPIGISTSYLPASVQTASGTADFSFSLQSTVNPSLTNNETAVKRTWVLGRTAGVGNPSQITLQWNLGDEGSSFTRSSGSTFLYSTSYWASAGSTSVSGTNPYTATVTGLSTTGSYMVATAYSLSGKVYEDVNYGGGAGRNWATASANGGSARSGARLELFESNGYYVSSATADASGNYSFSGLANGTYYVRSATGSVSSSRTGYTVSCLPVMTYRATAASGSALAVTDYVGGQDPATTDAGNASSGWVLNSATGAFSGSGSGKAHAFSQAGVGTASISSMDFGWNFDTVVNINDSGQGSLRQFLVNANLLSNTGLTQSGRTAGTENALWMISNGTAAAGLRIANNYFSGGIATLAPTSALPAVTDSTVIDAQTQPGWSSAPIIELNGTSAGAGARGIEITAGSSTVRGLIINRFTGSSNSAGIWLSTAGSNTIQGNYIGTNSAGSAASANYQGIYVSTTSSSNTIGGSSASQRNVLSGNTWRGIMIGGGSGNSVKGNYAGLNAAGTGAVANTIGIYLLQSSSNTIGGTAAGEGNVVSGNSQIGVYLVYSTANSNVIQGNTIGLNAAKSSAVANGTQGIELCCTGNGAINNTIGGSAAGAANTISGNTGAGIKIWEGTGNLISRNSIYGNGGIGIDLKADGVTVNNGTKSASLANYDMDYAVFTSGSLSGTSLTVGGYVGGAASQPTFAGATVEIFKSDSDATDYGEGQTWLGTLTADANGNFSGTISVSGINPGDKLTGTATDASNNSSEFGANFSITAIFYSKSSSAVDTASNWNSARNGTGTDAASFFPNCTWTLQNTHAMTLSASSSWNVQSSGVVQVESGGSWTNTSSGTVTIGTLQLDNGGTYSHSTTATFPGTTRTFGATSTVNYSASADQSVVAVTYGHLAISGSGTKTLAGSASVQGDLSVEAGTLDLSTYTANRSSSGGTLSIYNSATLKIGGTNGFPSNYSSLALGATSTVNYYGSAQSVAGITYGHLTVSAAGTKTLAATASVMGDLTISAGTFDLGSYTANRASAGGTLSISNGATLKIGSTNGFPSNYSSLVLGATSTVDYYGTNQPVSAITYGHLNLSTSGTKTFAAGTTYILGDLTVSGSATGNGTTNSTTINFSGTGAQAVAAIAYHHLTLSTSGTKTLSASPITVAGNFSTSGTATATCTGNLTVNGTASLGSGSTFNGGSGTLDFNSSLTSAASSFTATSGTMYVAGDFNNSSSVFTHNSGTIVLDGTDATMTTGGATFNNITLNKELYLQITGALTLAGQLNLTYGFLIQDTNNNLQAGSIQIGYNGNLRNWGTGSLTVGGTVNNDGRIDFNGGNDSVCGSATKIQIRSTVNGNQRSWTSSGGTGRFFMVDVDVKDQGGSATIVCYGSANNGNVGANWTINGGCVGAPTLIRLVSFAARAGSGGVELAWQTGFEVDNLGFRIYREDSAGRATVTPSIIAGSALFAGRGTELSVGRSYRWWDGEGRAGARYWLEDLDLSGKRTLHGPVAAVMSNLKRSIQGEAQPLSQVGRNSGLAPVFGPPFMSDGTSVPKTGACTKNSEPCGPPGGEIPGTGTYFRSYVPTEQNAGTENRSQSRISPDAQVVQWELAAHGAVKIGVRQAGWYRVSQPQLAAAGLDPLVDPRRLQLYADGLEQAIQVRGESDGRLDSSDTLEFYGQGLDTRWTDTRIYWLVEGTTAGKRIATHTTSAASIERPDVGATHASPAVNPDRVLLLASSANPEDSSFSHTLEKRPRTVYFAALRNGEADNFFGPVVTTEPLAETLRLTNLDPSASSNLGLRLQGATDKNHTVRIEVNGADTGRRLQFAGQASFALQVPLAAGQLREGDNVIRLTALGGEEDVSLVDTLRVTYAHRFVADTPAQFLTLPGGKSYALSGFASSTIRVLVIETPDRVRELMATTAPQGAGFAVTFAAPGTPYATLLVFTDTGIQTPAFVRADQPSTWNQPAAGADVVMVAPSALLPSLARLKTAQEQEGWTVATVDVEDLCDEFAYGTKTPYAIRSFLQRARSVWTKPSRFLLLAGDASYDPHDYLGTGTPDLLPTMMVDSGYLETASDDWFADLDGVGFPQLAVGRLPAKSKAEAEALIGKLLDYRRTDRQAAWAQEVFLAADTPDTFDFEAATRKVKAAASGGNFQVQELYRAAAGDAAARKSLLAAINAGKLVINYLGHSSVDEWRGKLLTIDDTAALSNGSRLPLFLMMGCLSNYFIDVEGDSLGEALLRAPGGGAVGVWASSGLALPERQLEVNLELYKYLMNGGTTVGEALLRAKVTAGDAEFVKTWVYLGDPTLQLVPLQPGSRCDVNGDGKLDLADLQLLIYVILGQASCPGNCDLNRDSAVNMLDFLLLSGTVRHP